MIQRDVLKILDRYTPAKYITSSVGTTTLYQYPNLSVVRTQVAGKDFYCATFKGHRLQEEDAKKLYRSISNDCN